MTHERTKEKQGDKQKKVEQKLFIPNWKNRPKHCRRTISGRHIPIERIENYTLIFSCSACGLIDDTGEFSKWMGYGVKKIDDTKQL